MESEVLIIEPDDQEIDPNSIWIPWFCFEVED